MSTKQIGPVLGAWYKWKSLRLPWRKRFLVGLDLRGNTYWEFRLARGDPTSHPSGAATSAPAHQSQRNQTPTYPFRRIVRYPRPTHYSEVTVPPAWHQWLRYRRASAPTLEEQLADAARQERIKVLAAQADARWAAKPGYLDAPPAASSQQQRQQQKREQPGRDYRAEDGVKSHIESPADMLRAQGTEKQGKKPDDAQKKRVEEDPWKQADARRGGPSETWQPQAWNPSSAPRRR
ncbi:hypothetical protein DL762_000107 [Monosporascus cannonballus]|uniref:NADH dehydrogenase [ubiquinone] 1 alpha subcomplex subunit n=1 Tax=Monosporascus cannonballus TaxID=155416 RepID=A0ABY0HM68_9PEZI|nr:hypothetical protein DL762_000107 [Monosporascus cannonballus]